jgi:hypothetical protein
MITREIALQKGYLKNEKVKIVPVIRKGRMINDPAHVGYFMFDGASVSMCLPQDERGVLANPFASEEEKKFFEVELDLDLNVHKKKENFWKDFYVKVTKDAAFMQFGIELDLSDPMDMLRYKVVKLQNIVAPSLDQSGERPEYKFALVSSDYEDRSAFDEMTSQQKIWTYWGSIKDSTRKMKDFLTLYLMTKKQDKEVPDDATIEFLSSEINKAIDKDKELILSIIDDENAPLKLFVAKAVKIGAIQKLGVNAYTFPGAEVRYTLAEMVEEIKHLKNYTDDQYLKIEAQINRFENRGKIVEKVVESKEVEDSVEVVEEIKEEVVAEAKPVVRRKTTK